MNVNLCGKHKDSVLVCYGCLSDVTAQQIAALKAEIERLTAVKERVLSENVKLREALDAKE